MPAWHSRLATLVVLVAGVVALVLWTGRMPVASGAVTSTSTAYSVRLVSPSRAIVHNPARRAVASWYGPGFYGHRTACGQTLRLGTMGVAHRSLPCGTWVCLAAGVRRVCVQVIDRGPYVAGRTFDLTAATHARLGLTCGVCTVSYRTT